MPPAKPTGSLGAWFDRAARPGWFIALFVAALYAQVARLPFMVDDYRNLRQFRAYRDGTIARPDLYRFLDGPQRVRQERDRGYIPWWVDDGLRFQYFRPISEYSLYLDYRVFGERPWGFRLTNVLLFLVGVRLVLALFRAWGDERRARWAALVFGVAAPHAVTIAFPAARCDLIAFVAAAATALFVYRFLRDGGVWRVAAACATLVVGLGSKEAFLPTAASPLMFWLAHRIVRSRATLSTRRTLAMQAAFVAIVAAFLAFYASGHFGTTSRPMLDPFGATADYLVRAPGRILLYLASWFLLINPFFFCFQQKFEIGLWIYGVLGGAVVAWFGHWLWQRVRHDHAVVVAGLWALAFVPVIACHPADSRLLMIPAMGLAYLTAVWLTHGRPPGNLARLPCIVFLMVSPFFVGATHSGIGWTETQSRRILETGLGSFGRPPAPTDRLWVINAPMPFYALWAQDRLESFSPGGGRVAFLSDIPEPEPDVIGPRRLRLRAAGSPFLSSFIGQLGRARGGSFAPGVAIALDGYSVTPNADAGGTVRELIIDFDRPLSDPGYRFLRVNRQGQTEALELSADGRALTPTTRPATE